MRPLTKVKFQGNVGVGLVDRPGLFAAPEFRLSAEDPPSYAGLQVCLVSLVLTTDYVIFSGSFKNHKKQ